MLISLIGLPGAGKSTIGRRLARRLGVVFVDTDAAIEEQLSTTVSEIFRLQGEAYFRTVEQQVLGELLSKVDGVIATGGGVVLRDANRDALHHHSTVVYLHAVPHRLQVRVRRNARRPLLQGHDPLKRLEELYEQRDSLYRQAAHIVVDSESPSPGAAVDEILTKLQTAWPTSSA